MMEEQVTLLWKRYKSGKSYQASMGFIDSFPQCIDFKEGRQWSAPTKATKHLPRPVFNICEFLVRTKRSHILNQNIKMVFSPAEGEIDLDPMMAQMQSNGAKAYSDYATALWREIGQDDLNEECIDDAATLGTGILHYYWDDSVTGGNRYPYKGALRGEVLDPLCVLFGNPQETDVQSQPYIIVASRVTIDAARRMARAEGLSEDKVKEICPDDETPDSYQASTLENNEEKKCTLLTMYYRDSGVRYSRGTKTQMLFEGRSLTPNVADKAPNKETDTDEVPSTMDLYPIAIMPWSRRKRSIYGIGEIEGIIPTQKAVNWCNAMNLLSVQDTAFPKLIVRPGALRQNMTNSPGEIIEDHSPTGNGINYLQGVGASQGAMQLSQTFLELVRELSGVSEVVSGEPISATMAASAIIALQNQAKKPIENVQKRFYRVLEDVGRIWEEFFKFYYSTPRPIAVENAMGEDDTILFVGSDFASVEFRLKIDVGAGGEWSESLSQATLDKLFDAQQIGLKTYIKLCPDTVMPFKESLLREIERKEQEQMMMGQMPTDPQQTAPMSDSSTGERAPLGIPIPSAPTA